MTGKKDVEQPSDQSTWKEKKEKERKGFMGALIIVDLSKRITFTIPLPQEKEV